MMEESSLISHEAYGPDIAGVLIPRHRVAACLDELARRITEAYPDGELTILAALMGSLIFLSDLVRRLPLRLRLDCGDLYRNLPDVCLLRDLAGGTGR